MITQCGLFPDFETSAWRLQVLDLLPATRGYFDRLAWITREEAWSGARALAQAIKEGWVTCDQENVELVLHMLDAYAEGYFGETG
jgi:hypothetical protein